MKTLLLAPKRAIVGLRESSVHIVYSSRAGFAANSYAEAAPLSSRFRRRILITRKIVR